MLGEEIYHPPGCRHPSECGSSLPLLRFPTTVRGSLLASWRLDICDAFFGVLGLPALYLPAACRRLLASNLQRGIS